MHRSKLPGLKIARDKRTTMLNEEQGVREVKELLKRQVREAAPMPRRLFEHKVGNRAGIVWWSGHSTSFTSTRGPIEVGPVEGIERNMNIQVRPCQAKR